MFVHIALMMTVGALTAGAVRAQTHVVQTSFEENEAEPLALGSVHGQDAWVVSAGGASVVQDSTVARTGTRGLLLGADQTPFHLRYARYGGREPGLGNTVYFDVWVKVDLLEDQPLTLLGYDLFGDSEKRAFVVDLTPPENGSGTVRIYDGWEKTPLGAYTPGAWHRITGQVDFDQQLYQVSLDAGTPLSVNFREDYTPKASGSRGSNREFHELRLMLGGGDAAGTVEAALDDLYIGTEQPEGVTFADLVTRYTVHVLQPSVGTITLAPDGTTFAEGATVTATYTPDPGYRFCGWLGDVSGETAPLSVTVDDDLVIGAETCADHGAAPVGRRITVASVDALKDALASARPGDIIDVAAGTYADAGYLSIVRGGVPDHPVTIRAQQRGTVTFTGASHFAVKQAAHVVLEGFVFETEGGTIIKTESSRHVRIRRNVFRPNETASGKWVLIGGTADLPHPMSDHNRVDHNLFENKSHLGNFITIDGSRAPDARSSQYDRIDHNHFKNTGPRATNEKEAVRIGWSEISRSSGFTTVEANLFEACDGDPEIVSVKTGDNVIRHNTFRRSAGTLSLRHGDRNEVAGNIFLGEGKQGTGGIRVYGDDHRLYNNYFSGLTGTRWDAPIAITNGDADYPAADLTKHFRPRRIEVVHNTLVGNAHHIEIGYTGSGYGKPPSDLVFANNLIVGDEGDLVHMYTAPTSDTWTGNLAHPTGTAALGIDVAASEIRLADPLLQQAGELWTLTSASPAVNAGVGGFDYVTADIHGQAREVPDVGADEFATTPVRFRPLTAEDVGPDGPEDAFSTASEPSDAAVAGTAVQLLPPYPQPARVQVVLPFLVARPALVELAVFDLLGREVARLVDQPLQAGQHDMNWVPQGLAAGAYVVRVRAGDAQQARLFFLYD